MLKEITYPRHFLIIIGKPLIEVEQLGFGLCLLHKTETEERYLPKILVDLGVFPSTSEIRRNRKDLLLTLDKLDMHTIKIGHRIIDVVVGL